MDDDKILIMQHISKRFDSIQALNDVYFDLRKGEIHALVGENGAGKSTLLNILSGAFKQDSGDIYLNGENMRFNAPHDAICAGIVKVHQETQLVSEISVARNIFLGNEPTGRFGAVDFLTMEKKADEMLEALQVDFKSNTITKDLSTAQQQMVEIAKALQNTFDVIALDEPTASLTNREIEELFCILNQLRDQGKAIIYISHRLDEVFEICDRVTVLRDGQLVDSLDVKSVDKAQLVRKMVGRDIGDENFRPESPKTLTPALEVRNFSGTNDCFQNINLEVYNGEVLGLAGLVGAGRTELVRAVFGADKISEGEIFINGKKVNIHSPEDAIKSGIMLIPEDRKAQGFVPELTNTANVALSNLNKYVKRFWLSFNLMNKKVDELTEKIDVQPRNNTIKTGRLSGGNQQKIVIAKALNVEPDILILDEPTKGIDVKAKQEIYELIRSFAESGRAILIISSELPEILKLCNRIIVMYEGRITGEIKSEEATEDLIMHYAVGG